MKLTPICLGTVGLMFFILRASSATLFVDLNSTHPVSPYAGWDTAATNIQDAIDASSDGDQIWVTNGIYQTGGRVMAGDLTNRVALYKAITVQSVNGPFVTIIQGEGMANGTAAVRCAWLTNGASLVGFTLQGGATRTAGDISTLRSGGAAWCAASSSVVTNCVLNSNTASYYGGGCYQGSLKNCFLTGNVAGSYGGGAVSCTLMNCFIGGNKSAGDGGGTYGCMMNNCTVVSNSWNGVSGQGPFTNCIVYFNMPFNGGSLTAFHFCCTTVPGGGNGNITNLPGFLSDGIHLGNASPCRGAGTNPATGTDIFGNVWSNPPSIGCAEWQPTPTVASPLIQLTGDPTGFTVSSTTAGQSPLMYWWLKDSVPLQDNGHFSSTQTSNLVATGVSYSDAGSYQLVVSNAFDVVTSTVAQLVVHCVDVAGTNPIAPYLTWETAATTIQDAITAASAGDIVLVTNGIYASGGKIMESNLLNRVALDKAMIVQSLTGPAATIIQGMWNPTVTNGPSAVRCAWLTNGATLSGFTLRGGGTRVFTYWADQQINGGGVWGSDSNSATLFNCVITTNGAYYNGGGAYQVTLNYCTLTGNHAVGSGMPGGGVAGAGSGGGAANCNLKNCLVASNFADQLDGGGAQYCRLINCAVTRNSAIDSGGGAGHSTLINCTVSLNKVGYGLTSYGYGGGVANSSLTNCIVSANLNINNFSPSTSNLYSSTLIYCCTLPLSPGIGNFGADPQLLGDGVHLAATSPCRGAGINIVIGTDIDGQPWTNPPSIGCDEWWPTPVIAVQPNFEVGTTPHTLNFNVSAAGQPPFGYWWSKDGVAIQDGSHYSSSSTPNLTVNNFDVPDAGAYQVVVSNSFGIATSQLAQVVVHCADAAGTNPTPPYLTWATAATTIQDAINVASAGEIVLVTNGIYATGGKVMAGDLTNRVALDKALTVTSENGYAATVIQGAWNPGTTNGPLAVRCAWLTNGATLSGFTLQGGATRSTGDFDTLLSGGGLWCAGINSTNPMPNYCRNCLISGNSAAYSGGGAQGGYLFNCLLTNNSAIYGGGIAFGTLNNSLVTYNLATYGAGACDATLNNCTVVNNYSTAPFSGASVHGGGTYGCIVRNSIVVNNFDAWPNPLGIDNYFSSTYSYSCTYPLPSGTGNINGNSASQQFLDLFHLATTSPCRSVGSALYTSGTDLDGEPWANPPSMGCDEVVVSNLVGPLSVVLIAAQSNLLVSPPDVFPFTHPGFFQGIVTGRASSIQWSFGDGLTSTNTGAGIYHAWANPGDYMVTFTAYNNDNPDGVSTNTLVHVLLQDVPQLQSPVLLTNGFHFQFLGQSNANYTIQYTTNLAPPVTWQTLRTIYYNFYDVIQVNDSTTNPARFYRVLAQ